MTESAFERIEDACKVLNLDFTSREFAFMVEEYSMNTETVDMIATVFERMAEKNRQTTIETILRLSRLPLKDPKTFESFNFSLSESLPEALAEFLRDHNEESFITLLSKNGIPYQSFHF